MMELTLPNGGTLTYLERADWDNSGRPRRGTVLPAERFTSVTLHHTVNIIDDVPGFGDEIAFMRRLRTIRPDLGEDVPYHHVVFAQADPRSVVVAEGRGFTRSAAHGGRALNSSSYGVAFAGNTETEAFTDGCVAGVRWVGSHIDRPNATTGHRDHKSTLCPGRNAYARLSELQPPFTEQDDPMVDANVLARLDELEAVARLTRDPGELVDRTYLTVLGRKADRVGRAHWVKFLTDGGSVARMVALFEMSPEARK